MCFIQPQLIHMMVRFEMCAFLFVPMAIPCGSLEMQVL